MDGQARLGSNDLGEDTLNAGGRTPATLAGAASARIA